MRKVEEARSAAFRRGLPLPLVWGRLPCCTQFIHQAGLQEQVAPGAADERRTCDGLGEPAPYTGGQRGHEIAPRGRQTCRACGPSATSAKTHERVERPTNSGAWSAVPGRKQRSRPQDLFGDE